MTKPTKKKLKGFKVKSFEALSLILGTELILEVPRKVNSVVIYRGKQRFKIQLPY